MLKDYHLRKFLGVDRITDLVTAVIHEGRTKLPAVKTFSVFIALIIGVLPIIAAGNPASKIDFSTVLIGLAACLSIFYRRAHHLPFKHSDNWKRSLSLTHTAFALGCIPAVIIAVFLPEAFSYKPQQSSNQVVTVIATRTDMIMIALKVSIWAAVTEEFIYRGLVVAVLRRWGWIKSQFTRDIFAVLIGGALFGAVHFPEWGLTLSLCLTGLGIGLGFAYIASGELLLPIILYHAAFDFLSLLFALYSNKL